MARSASDATRFTATMPTAYNKPSSPSSSSTIQNLGRGAIPGETPQQKIARLRAAAATARAAKETNFDRIVRSGRKWADRAHRLTAYSLIGLTVASGVVASFAIGDMLMHNRRKRSEWLATQQANHRAKLDEARAQLAAGHSITEDQMLLLNQERAAQEAAAAQQNKKGIFGRAKDALLKSVPDEEVKGGKIGAAAAAAAARDGLDDAQNKVAHLGIVSAVEEKVDQGKRMVETGLEHVNRTASDATTAVAGGPLDREAKAATDAVAKQSKSWADWIMRR